MELASGTTTQHSLNSTTYYYEEPETFEPEVWYIILGIPTILFAGLGNLGTIIAFFTDPSVSSKPSDLIILNLAFADFGMAIFTIPIFQIMVGAYGRWPWGELPCRVLLSMAMVLIFAGILFVILMSLDRYLMLALQYHDYLKKQSIKRVKISIALTWLVSTTQAVYEYALWDVIIKATDEKYRTDFDKECECPSMRLLSATFFCAFVFSIIPIVVIATLGILILLNLRRRLTHWKRVGFEGSATSESSSGNKTMERGMSTKNKLNPLSTLSLRSKGGESKKNDDNRTIRNRYIKPILTYIVLVLSLTACTLPVSIYIVVVNLNCPECYDYFTSGYLFGILFFNSCLNPFLYALTNTKIRAFYRRKYNELRRCIKTG